MSAADEFVKGRPVMWDRIYRLTRLFTNRKFVSHLRTLCVEPLEDRALLTNDAFASAIALASGATTGGTTVGATAESGEPAHAGDAAQKSVWYSLTLSAGASATVTVTPTSVFDVQLAVYTGSAVNSLLSVASADNGADGEAEHVQFTNSSATTVTYAIAVDGFVGDSGTFNLNVVSNSSSAPVNDAFANPLVLAAGVTITGTTLGATAQTGEPAHASDPAQRSVWYSLTLPAGASATVTVTPTSVFDVQLAAYSGSALNGLISVASADNGAAGEAEQVQFTNSGAAAVTYAIAVDGFASASGTFNVNAEVNSPPAAPANDAFSSAVALVSSLITSGTTIAATAQAGEPAHAGDPAQKSVWYSLVVPANMSVTVVLAPTSNFDAQLAVYAGSAVNNLSAIASADAAAAGQAEQLLFHNLAVSAVTYVIAIDGFANASGTFNLSATIGELVGANNPPTCTIGNPQNATDETGPQSIPNWVIDCSANDPGQSIVAVSLSIDKPEFFTVAPTLDGTGKLTFDPQPNVHGTAQATITVKDDGGTANGGVDETKYAVQFSITKPHRLFNAAQTGERRGLDTTGSTSSAPDGFIVAADVLAVINYINAKGSGPVTNDAPFGPPYVDVTGDNQVVAEDALKIINWINANPGESEGEAASFAPVSHNLDEILNLLASDLAAQPKRRRQ